MTASPEKRAVGRLEWIGVRRMRRGGVTPVESVEVIAGRGLADDHAARRAAEYASGNKRQVTLIQHEHLPLIARFAGVDKVAPAALRRNLVVSGVNLQTLKRKRFRIGGATFEATGDCAPCRRMEQTIGRGGFDAMRGHGGLTAIVLDGGRISVGDEVVVVGDASS